MSPLIMMFAISLVTGGNAFEANPLWSDELDYWRGIYSFSERGFDTGYSGMYEAAPALGAFSTHGFSPLMWYGLWALIFGWKLNSIVVCNLALVTAGMLIFVIIARPKPLAAVLTALIYLLLPYTPLYAATSMTESVNYALLLPYIAALYRYERGRERRMLAVLFVLAAICTLYRATYFIMLLLPLAVFAGERSAKRTALYFVIALACATGLYVISSMFTAPFPDGFMYRLFRADGAYAALRMLGGHFKLGFIRYFLTSSGTAVEDAFRVAYMTLMALCLAGSLFGRRRPVHFVCLLTLFVPLMTVLTLYEVNVWCDFRTLAPFLFGVAAYLALRGMRALPCLALCGCAALTAVMYLSPVGALTEPERFGPFPENPRFTELCDRVEYTENALSPFQNSVRMDVMLPEAYAHLPAGIGIEFGVLSANNCKKSRYYLTPCADAGDLPGYECVERNESGALFRRIDESWEGVK